MVFKIYKIVMFIKRMNKEFKIFTKKKSIKI